MSSHQQSEVSKKSKKKKDKNGNEQDPISKAAMDKKIIKVCKQTISDLKSKLEILIENNSKLTKENEKLVKDLDEKFIKNQ